MSPQRQTENTLSPANSHVPILDGLRGLAILLVLVFHSFAIFTPASVAENVIFKLTQTAWCGVDLFFVLSGFLITGILLDTKGSRHFFRTFYLRRALRIFPLYYAFLAVYLVFLPTLCLLLHRHAPPHPAGLTQTWYWLYLLNWRVLSPNTPHWMPHFWSLAVEEQFYICWPFVVFLSGRKTLLKVCMVLAGGAWLTRLAMLANGTISMAYELTPTHLDGLVMGAMAAVILRDPRLLARIRAHLNTALVIAAGLLASLIVWAKGLEMDKFPVLLNAFTLLGLLFTVILIALLLNVPSVAWIRPLFQTRWLRTFGNYSYSMYVFHTPFILLFLRDWGWKRFLERSPHILRMPEACAFAGLVTTLSYGAARISWKFLENPFLQLKRYFPRETADPAILPSSQPVLQTCLDANVGIPAKTQVIPQ